MQKARNIAAGEQKKLVAWLEENKIPIRGIEKDTIIEIITKNAVLQVRCDVMLDQWCFSICVCTGDKVEMQTVKEWIWVKALVVMYNQ